MKVTVSFDAVRLVVPCGDGHLQIGQLVDRAVARYCKTVGKVRYSRRLCRIRIITDLIGRRRYSVRMNTVTETPVG